METPVPSAAPEPAGSSSRKRRTGWMRYLPLIVLIVIVLVAALVGFYLYGLTLEIGQSREDAAAQAAASASVSDASSSDLQETNSIETDLDSTNVDGSDSGVNDIDANFQQ